MKKFLCITLGLVAFLSVLCFPSSAFQYLGGSDPVAYADPSVSGVKVTPDYNAQFYPGTDVYFSATVSGASIVPGSPESTVYWFVHGNTSEDTYLQSDPYGMAILHIANDETSTELVIEAVSTYDTTKSHSVEIPVIYPMNGVSIVPGSEGLPESGADRTIQYSLQLATGDPYEYQYIEWILIPTDGHESYFWVNDTGLVTIKGGAPVGSGYLLTWAYLKDMELVSSGSVRVKILSNDEVIRDQLGGFINGDHGFNSGGSDFSGAADGLQNSQQQMAGAIAGGMGTLSGMMGSKEMVSTLTTLGMGFNAVFEGHEVTICGVTANPFGLAVSLLTIALLLILALNYIFRKRGG